MKNVLLIDSGSGGVNVLAECVKVVPTCNYLLFCDSKNLPYGDKTKEELQDITLANLKNIRKFFVFDIVVLACNTLTSTCIDRCRKEYPNIEFVGTVPAIKPALMEFDKEDVLVLATQATLDNNVLIRKNKGVVLKAMPSLAQKIDENIDDLEILKDELKNELQKCNQKAIVLGCTHYFCIKELLCEIFGKNIKIFDSANGVARRLKYLVGDEEKNYQVQIMTTGNESFLARFWWYFQKL